MPNIIKVDPLKRPIKLEYVSSVPTTITVSVGQPGPQGLPGPQQVFYQSAQPPVTGTPWLWFETDINGDVNNLWINDGNA